MSTDLIDDVLAKNPQFTTVEDVIAECKKRGVEIGLWPVVFAARRMGRSLERRLTQVSHSDEVRLLAQELLQELHGSKAKAIEYLSMATNQPAGKVADEYKLCIAEELIKASGGVQAATEALKKHSNN